MYIHVYSRKYTMYMYAGTEIDAPHAVPMLGHRVYKVYKLVTKPTVSYQCTNVIVSICMSCEFSL